MKKAISIAMALMMLLSLSVAAYASPVRASDESTEAQIGQISGSLASLKQDEASGAWFYTVTDMDHNGRLELIAASEQGAGKYTYVKIWEIGEDMSTLTECKVNIPEDESFPDILAENADTYYDPASDSWSYMFYDNIVLSDQEAYYAKCAISFTASELGFRQLAVRHTQVVNGVVNDTYMDNNGNTISGEQYNDSFSTGTMEFIRSNTNFDWVSSADADEARLKDSYAVFKGVKMPPEKQQEAEIAAQAATTAANPAPAATPAPVAAPAPTNFLTITKNPTNESRSVGETAWFISGASGYTSLTWTFVSQSGGEYNVQNFRNTFPYATVSGEDGTTLTISNLSTEMSGWGVYCTFYNNGQTARTNTAYMYVTAKTYTQSNNTNQSQVYYYSDYYGDSYVYADSDGSVAIYYPDGSSSIDFDDGTAIDIDSDGSETYWFNDGTAVHFDADGTVTEFDIYGNSSSWYPELYNDYFGWGSYGW